MKSLACVKAANGSPQELEGCRAERGRATAEGRCGGLRRGGKEGSRSAVLGKAKKYSRKPSEP